MKTQIAVTDSEVTKMIQGVILSEGDGAAGRATYLRSLVAAVQIELGGKPVLSQIKGRVRSPGVEACTQAVETAHARFYALVLAALDSKELDAPTRNARSVFARSAASTLRSAVKYELNPMALVLPNVTKESLRKWTKEHRPAQPIDTAAGIRKARALVKSLASYIEPLGEGDKATVLSQFHRELDALDAVVNYEPDAGAHRRTHIIPASRGRAGEPRTHLT